MHRLEPAREHLIGLYRIVIGILFACHGLKTIFGLFGSHPPVADPERRRGRRVVLLGAADRGVHRTGPLRPGPRVAPANG